LEGSIQRSGNRLRVNVQLIDAESGGHLWAERFDKPVADLFDMQDENLEPDVCDPQVRPAIVPGLPRRAGLGALSQDLLPCMLPIGGRIRHSRLLDVALQIAA
jgi:hypothetical protein